jgi:transcriptional regulator with XRE-family HTH domain
MSSRSIQNRPPEVQEARDTLRRKGWSQAEAAVRLCVSTVHLNYVLTGKRQSRRILRAIAALPENPRPA